MIVGAPARFEGTDAEREANRRSHYFDPMSGRCMDCDCRPFGRVADYPCGVEPPRAEDPGYDREFDARFRTYAALGGNA